MKGIAHWGMNHYVPGTRRGPPDALIRSWPTTRPNYPLESWVPAPWLLTGRSGYPRGVYLSTRLTRAQSVWPAGGPTTLRFARPARMGAQSGEWALPARSRLGVVRTWLRQRAASRAMARLPWPVTVEALSEAMRTLLRDDSLEILYWTQHHGGYVNADGLPADPLVEQGHRCLVAVEDPDGKPLAALLVDPGRAREPDLLATVLPASAPAMLAARLEAVLRAQGEELRVLHRQALEVDWKERRELERQLHDGAQSRLSALSMRLGAARHTAWDSSTGTLLDDMQSEVRIALGELREIASGIHPTMLTESGLSQALEAAVDRAPFPVRVVAPPERFPPGVEAFAYYVICQVLASAARRPVTIGVDVLIGSAPDTMVIDIAGRTEPAPWPTSGSAQPAIDKRLVMADCPFAVRLRAAGGTLVVTEQAGTGTTLRVRIPCL
jgi:signal transduction histidine kinase